MRKSQFHNTYLARLVELQALGVMTAKQAKQKAQRVINAYHSAVYFHNANFTNDRRYSVRFSKVPFKYDVIRQVIRSEHYGYKTVNEIKLFYLWLRYANTHFLCHYYKGLMSLRNGRTLANRNGEPYVSTFNGRRNIYKLLNKSISRLNSYLRKKHLPLYILVHGIEDKPKYDGSYNVHAHLELMTVNRPLSMQLKQRIANYLVKPKATPNDLKLNIQPLKRKDGKHNVISNGKHDKDNLRAIAQFTQYIIKQGRLPIAKTYTDVETLRRLKRYGKLSVMLTAILNSTKRLSLKGHARFKTIAKNIINRYGQFSLINAKKYDTAPKHNAISKHHYSTTENVRRFNHLNIYTGKPLKHYAENRTNGKAKDNDNNVPPSVDVDRPKYAVDVKNKVLAYRLSLDRRRYRKRNKYAVISTPASHDAKASDVTPFNTS